MQLILNYLFFSTRGHTFLSKIALGLSVHDTPARPGQKNPYFYVREDTPWSGLFEGIGPRKKPEVGTLSLENTNDYLIYLYGVLRRSKPQIPCLP